MFYLTMYSTKHRTEQCVTFSHQLLQKEMFYLTKEGNVLFNNVLNLTQNRTVCDLQSPTLTEGNVLFNKGRKCFI